MGRKTLANGDIQDSSIGHNPEPRPPRPPQQRATGWLTREVRDQLDAAGYYAVPKEAVAVIYAEELVSYLDQMHFGNNPGFVDSINRKLALGIGLVLLREGHLQVHLSEVKEYGDTIRHRVEVTVFKPRTIPIVK